MAIQHDPIDRSLPQAPGVNPKLTGNVSVWPDAHQGGEVKTDGKTVTNVDGPFKIESPRQPRDR
jgi:hypothetical protein